QRRRRGGIVNVTKSRRRRRRPSSDALAGVRAEIVRRFGVRLKAADLDQLDDDAAREVVELVRRLHSESREPLSGKERAKLERLIGEAAGVADLFARRREAQAAESKFAELARRAKLPGSRPLVEQPGSVRIPAVAFAHLDRPDPAFFVSELGLLV